MTVDQFDAVVVGAGTGGALTALTLAEKNAKVLLIDSKEEKLIGKKICGDALGIHHIKNVGIPFPPKETFKGVLDTVRVYSPSTKNFVNVEGKGFALNRYKFGRWLLDMALDKGAELLPATRAEDIVFEDGRAEQLKIVDTKTKDSKYVKAKYFVDASGFICALRRQIPDTLGVDKEIRMSDVAILYREIRKVEKVEDLGIAKIFLDQGTAPGGYWWYFPQDEHTLNIGIGIQGGKNINPKDAFTEILRRRTDLQKSEILDAGGGVVSLRRSLYTLVAYNVLFVGDAAYTANPIHGGGIGPSMLTGRACGQAIINALNNTEKEKEELWAANVNFVKMYGAKAASLDIFRIFLQALTNEEIEFGMAKKLITDEDVTDLGYGTADLSIKDKALKMLRGFSKPGVLKHLAETAKYMKSVKQEYNWYPTYENFPVWVATVERMFKEYSNKYLPLT
jgi:digeranylgeranylglycerophospholipid reductase